MCVRVCRGVGWLRVHYKENAEFRCFSVDDWLLKNIWIRWIRLSAVASRNSARRARGKFNQCGRMSDRGED